MILSACVHIFFLSCHCLVSVCIEMVSPAWYIHTYIDTGLWEHQQGALFLFFWDDVGNIFLCLFLSILSQLFIYICCLSIWSLIWRALIVDY